MEDEDIRLQALRSAINVSTTVKDGLTVQELVDMAEYFEIYLRGDMSAKKTPDATLTKE